MCAQYHSTRLMTITHNTPPCKIYYLVGNVRQQEVKMEKYATASAMFTVQNLREKLDRLKVRYEHVSADLKNKSEPKNVQSIRRLEREFLMLDIKRIEKMIAQSQTPAGRYHQLFINIKRKLA